MGNSRVLQDADNQVNSGYGWRASTGSMHLGVDLVKWAGQLAFVIAHSDGVVEYVAKNVPGYLKGSFGNQVVIKHNAHEKTRYCHMKYGSITVVEGQQVSKGQVIGYMGATGNTTQPHLHLQYEVDGVAVDPIGIIGADLPGIYANLLVDGSWGDKTTKALQKALGVAADGNFGPISIKALQTKLGVRADGVYGPITKEALQTYLGVVADGDIGPITVKALQTKLNNGSF